MDWGNEKYLPFTYILKFSCLISMSEPSNYSNLQSAFSETTLKVFDDGVSHLFHNNWWLYRNTKWNTLLVIFYTSLRCWNVLIERNLLLIFQVPYFCLFNRWKLSMFDLMRKLGNRFPVMDERIKTLPLAAKDYWVTAIILLAWRRYYCY